MPIIIADGITLREPDITINGKILSFAESMTLRVALSTFMLQLSDPEFKKMLGPISDNYQEHARKILQHMMLGQ